MFLNEADKLLVLTALNAYGTELTCKGASYHVITPVTDLLNRVGNCDTETCRQIEQLLHLADIAEAADNGELERLGEDVEFEGDAETGAITKIRWNDEDMAQDFVEKLDYPSAVMFYDLLSERLLGDPDDDDDYGEDEEVPMTGNSVANQELADVLYGGPINVGGYHQRAKDFSFKTPKPTHMSLDEYLAAIDEMEKSNGTEDF